MTTPNPAGDLRMAIAEFIKAMPEEGSWKYEDCRDEWLKVEKVINSTPFRNYRKSFGRLALMLPSEGSEEEGERRKSWYFSNYTSMLQDLDKIYESIANRGRIELLDVGSLYTTLDVMLIHQESIDEAFASQ